jgi:hypothetical protein
MDPRTWGPHGWYFLHSTTFAYPDKPTKSEQNEIKRLFIEFKNTLPCITCRENYKKHLEKLPLTLKVLSCKTTLVNWLIDIHNEVNKMLKKPTLTYAQAIKIHSKKFL